MTNQPDATAPVADWNPIAREWSRGDGSRRWQPVINRGRTFYPWFLCYRPGSPRPYWAVIEDGTPALYRRKATALRIARRRIRRARRNDWRAV